MKRILAFGDQVQTARSTEVPFGTFSRIWDQIASNEKVSTRRHVPPAPATNELHWMKMEEGV